MKLFIHKWTTLNQLEFLEYMNARWFSTHSNWFEGEAESITPSTNNALESFNNVIKKEHTFREKLTVARFRAMIINMIRTVSESCSHELAGEQHSDYPLALGC